MGHKFLIHLRNAVIGAMDRQLNNPSNKSIVFVNRTPVYTQTCPPLKTEKYEFAARGAPVGWICRSNRTRLERQICVYC